MADHRTDAASVELLPLSRDESSPPEEAKENIGSQRSQARSPLGSKRWLPFTEREEAFAFGLLLIGTIPIILLAIYAPRLAAQLSSSACLPNGNFIIPGTASIWDPNYIFTITIAVGGEHSYTYVKVIDVLWDVLLGRGGQLLLVWIAYRTFHKSIMYIMQTTPVPFCTYGVVAFNAGGLHSIMRYISALGSSQTRKSGKAVRIYIMMALCTLYVVAMPTLFSAMTGYAVISSPSVELVNGYGRVGASPDYCTTVGNCTILPCMGGFVPIWAKVWDSARYGGQEPDWIAAENMGKDPRYQDPIYKYYLEHEDAYQVAASLSQCTKYYNGSILDDCAPLQQSSTVRSPADYEKVPLNSPLLNIEVLGNNDQGAPKAFKCPGFPTDLVFDTHQINQGYENGISALCTAGASYQWGFSFLLLLIVSILNLLFSVMMYALWVDARRGGNLKTREEVFTGPHGGRQSGSLNNPSNLRSALDISRQAELQYGREIHEWSTWKLDNVVWRGKKGIQLQGVS